VIRTFLFLTAASLRNRISRRLRRLREPRYLAGLAVGLVYLYFVVLRNQMRATRHGDTLFGNPGFVSALPSIAFVAGVGLWAFVLVAWLWPSDEPPLKFTGAEVQFFYPAPLARRQLLHYKLLRSQIGVAFGVLIAGLFSGALVAAASGQWTFLVGGLLAFTTLRLHLLGVAFTRASLKGATAAPLRAWLPPALMAILSLLFVVPLVAHVPELRRLELSEAWPRLLDIVNRQPAAIGFWPFRALVATVTAPAGSAFIAAAVPVLALLALNYWWVLQSDAALEQAAIAVEKQRVRGTRRLPAPVAREAPFRLGERGRPEFAILWKNLILLGRYASLRMALRLLAPIVILTMVLGKQAGGALVPAVGLFAAGFFTMLGPLMMRNDLRHDLPRLPVLKTWPIPGYTLLVGEILAPVVVLTVIVWAGLAVSVGASGGLPWPGSISDRVALGLGAAFVAPALITTQLLLQNAAVILFPGWIPTGGTRARGIEAMGQQMLMLVGTMLAMAVGVLPAAAVSGAVGFLLYGFAGFAGLVPAAVLFSVILIGEAVLVVFLLGRLLERTDPAQVEAEEA
jgi:ABC-2 type transport system permease protein